MENLEDRIEYLEQTVKQLVSMLCEKGCMESSFRFLTHTERMKQFEKGVDDFIAE